MAVYRHFQIKKKSPYLAIFCDFPWPSSANRIFYACQFILAGFFVSFYCYRSLAIASEHI